MQGYALIYLLKCDIILLKGVIVWLFGTKLNIQKKVFIILWSVIGAFTISKLNVSVIYLIIPQNFF